MNKVILTIAALCSFAAMATPSISITNEVQPVKIIAEYNNTNYDANTDIYNVGNNSMNQPRIRFTNNPNPNKETGCVIAYTSESGTFSFLQDIENEQVCDHIELSLKHSFRTQGCPVTISINTAKKDVESVVSACDFRASLDTNPII